MRHFVAIVLKFILVLVLLEILLGLITALSVAQILLISAAVTLLSYAIGDLLILPASNNIVATLCDVVLVFLTVWAFNLVPGYVVILVGTAAVCAAVLGIFEFYFHKYVASALLPNRRQRRSRM